MKALIRNKGETILETDGVPGIEWVSGFPLTASGWSGGPYILVNDYAPTADEDFDEEPETVTAPAEDEETVTINGKEYTVEEARKILGVKL